MAYQVDVYKWVANWINHYTKWLWNWI